MSEKLIVRSNCTKYTLDVAKRYRAHTFTRVSKGFLDDIESEVRSLIYRKVMSLPSKGKTIKGD